VFPDVPSAILTISLTNSQEKGGTLLISIMNLIMGTHPNGDLYPRRHLLGALGLAITVSLAGLIWPDDDRSPQASVPPGALDLVVGPAVPALPAIAPGPDGQAAAAESEPPVTEVPWQRVTVRSGDSLARIFKREDLRAADLQAVLDSDGEAARRLRRIHPGDVLQYRADDGGHLLALRYEFSRLEAMVATRAAADGDFDARLARREPERRIAHREAVINSSLFLASTAVGLDEATAMRLADIFQWDIDFVLDIRRGDSFHLVFEELLVDGEKIGNGAILAAEFVNRGERYQAVRYTDSEGYTSYYTPEGRSMRKEFLRAPLEFSRVSSSFNPNRRHPIWNTVRPHRGIDYAAPTGTPVKAAGDGKVITASRTGPNGNYVVIQHGETYQTKYLHLSRFAASTRSGRRVSQGDVIGYVGATGWASGPHLHYEFLVHGVHQNPRTVNLPKAVPIAAAERSRFMATTRELIARLEALGSGEQLAMAGDTTPTGG
jgi:murein DD-endopeptidase MepM/ murein hydrolase activator NlpD